MTGTIYCTLWTLWFSQRDRPITTNIK